MLASGKGNLMATKKPFLTDIITLRKRARQHLEHGAVTAGYKADRARVVKLLNEALATEIVCVLRYKRHYFMASGINAEAVAQEFHLRAQEKQGKRIALIGQVNQQLPFMYHDALWAPAQFDTIVDSPAYYTRLFGTPKKPVRTQDSLIGLYASTLIKDNGPTMTRPYRLTIAAGRQPTGKHVS